MKNNHKYVYELWDNDTPALPKLVGYTFNEQEAYDWKSLCNGLRSIHERCFCKVTGNPCSKECKNVREEKFLTLEDLKIIDFLKEDSK